VPYTDESLNVLFQVLERPDILQQERDATPAGRWGRISELYAATAALTPLRTTADWIERCAAARLPAMAVRDLADMLDDPHLRQTGFFTRRTHPTEGAFWEMAPPVRFGAADLPPPAPARWLGEDTDSVVRDLSECGVALNLTGWSTPEDGSTPTRDVRSLKEA
jgi:crotonobetainyl-CoA:carnitine CoA-transferase CaiB-like acyl-CoA transferase